MLLMRSIISNSFPLKERKIVLKFDFYRNNCIALFLSACHIRRSICTNSLWKTPYLHAMEWVRLSFDFKWLSRQFQFSFYIEWKCSNALSIDRMPILFSFGIYQPFDFHIKLLSTNPICLKMNDLMRLHNLKANHCHAFNVLSQSKWDNSPLGSFNYE